MKGSGGSTRNAKNLETTKEPPVPVEEERTEGRQDHLGHTMVAEKHPPSTPWDLEWEI